MGGEEFIIRDGTLIKYNGHDRCILIPGCVTAIGPHAFRDCIGLECINIPDSVQMLRNEAFAECPTLKHVNFRGLSINI